MQERLCVLAGLRAADGSAMLVFITSPVRVVVRTLASFVLAGLGDRNPPSITCHALERTPLHDNSVQHASRSNWSSQTIRPQEKLPDRSPRQAHPSQKTKEDSARSRLSLQPRLCRARAGNADASKEQLAA